MTIQRRIQITTVVLVLFVLAAIGTLFWSSRQVEHGIKRIETTSQVVRDAFMLKTLMDDYLDHGSGRALRQWDKLNKTLGQILDYEVISESIERPLLTDLKKVYRSVNYLYPRVVEMRASFDQNQDLKTKKMLTNLMSLQLEQLVIAASNLSEATQLLTLNRRKFVQELIVALGISTVLIIFINIYLIRKSVVRPLKVLSDGADRIGAGNFVQVDEMESDDEVGKLSQAFNTMVERLGKREMALTKATDELELTLEEREITIDFLQLVNESHGMEELIRASTTFFQQRSGCEAVGIRLHEGDDYPYFEARGFPEEFILLENKLCTYDENDRVCLDSDGSPLLECMCGNVIRGRFDPTKPFFTERGSFWTNCTTDLLASTTEEDRQSRTRNRCNGEGYESVALIPLRTSGEQWGLLQLNDKRKGRFTLESIALWERLAQYLAVALGKCAVEKELKESEARLKQSQAMAHLGSWELEVANNLLTWSDEVYRIFGLQPQEFKATYEAFLEAVHPDDRKAVDEAYSGSLRDGKDTYEIEHRLVRKLTGEVRIVQEKCGHIRDRSGRIIRSIGMVHDITELKRAELEIREMNESLENKVAERTAELTRSNADLQQFAYVASHDLQEPLRNVASCLQLLEKKYKNNLDAKADQYIHYAVESSVRMKNLILDLLTYSRIGTRGNPRKQTDCEQILDQTVRNLRSAISEAGAVITRDPLPTILADNAQLMQVFQNLIGNSIKFRGEQQPHVHVSAVKNKKEWIFSVKDNGIGIESRHLDRIFVIFQRLHKRSQYGGTGIGLAIVKKVVERHNGRVWVESEFGSGTTFYFTIPEKGIQA
jgi:PAS domain S-box-containing protein